MARLIRLPILKHFYRNWFSPNLQDTEKSGSRLEKEVRRAQNRTGSTGRSKKAQAILEDGALLSAHDELDKELLKEFQLMTLKPFIYVFNMDADQLLDEGQRQELENLVAPAKAIFLDAQFEADLVELDEEDAREMLEESGQSESGLDQLARVGFDTLGLQTYLTAGEKESRAWTIRKGWTAPQAAGVIHSDFERGFIKAEIIGFDELVELGSIHAAREAGKLRQEGKDYVMQDGDVVEFRTGLTSGGKK